MDKKILDEWNKCKRLIRRLRFIAYIYPASLSEHDPSDTALTVPGDKRSIHTA